MKQLILSVTCLIGLLLWIDYTEAHPDGATPYWYPSSFIYGYINGCADQVEKNQIPFTQVMWPEQVREVCGCVVDAFRHSVTYEEILDNATNNEMVLIATATFPVCVDEVLRRSSGEDQNN